MSTSAFFGAQVVVVSAPALFSGPRRSAPWSTGSGGGVVIECSSRPQKKATAHHKKTRPRKTQAWDIRRKPTVYSPLPPLPPDWLLSSDDSSSDATATATATATSSSSLESAPAT